MRRLGLAVSVLAVTVVAALAGTASPANAGVLDGGKMMDWLTGYKASGPVGAGAGGATLSQGAAARVGTGLALGGVRPSTAALLRSGSGTMILQSAALQIGFHIGGAIARHLELRCRASGSTCTTVGTTGTDGHAISTREWRPTAVGELRPGIPAVPSYRWIYSDGATGVLRSSIPITCLTGSDASCAVENVEFGIRDSVNHAAIAAGATIVPYTGEDCVNGGPAGTCGAALIDRATLEAAFGAVVDRPYALPADSADREYPATGPLFVPRDWVLDPPTPAEKDAIETGLCDGTCSDADPVDVEIGEAIADEAGETFEGFTDIDFPDCDGLTIEECIALLQDSGWLGSAETETESIVNADLSVGPGRYLRSRLVTGGAVGVGMTIGSGVDLILTANPSPLPLELQAQEANEGWPAYRTRLGHTGPVTVHVLDPLLGDPELGPDAPVKMRVPVPEPGTGTQIVRVPKPGEAPDPDPTHRFKPDDPVEVWVNPPGMPPVDPPGEGGGGGDSLHMPDIHSPCNKFPFGVFCWVLGALDSVVSAPSEAPNIHLPATEIPFSSSVPGVPEAFTTPEITLSAADFPSFVMTGLNVIAGCVVFWVWLQGIWFVGSRIMVGPDKTLDAGGDTE